MSEVTTRRITQFLVALVWLTVYGGAMLFLLFTWITPEPQDIVPNRQYMNGDNVNLLWQQDNIMIDEKLFTINETTLLAYSNRTPVDGYLTTIEVHTGQQQLWETAVAEPIVVKQYQNLLLIESDSSQYANAPTNNKSLKDCSDFGSTSIVALNINDGTLQWQYKYSGTASYSDFIVSDDVLYTLDTDDHGVSWSHIGIDVQTGYIQKRDCSKWPWERKPRPNYPVDKSKETKANEVYVFSEPRIKVGDYYEDNHVYTDGNALKILDGNRRLTLNFEGENLHSSQITIAILGKIWLIYLQDSNQLFAFEFDEPLSISE